jgi:hypothetical protein
VFPVISSAVFLSVHPSLIAAGFGLSVQLLSRGFSFRHDGGEGSRWKREKEGGRRRSGKACVADQTAGMMEQASTPSSICLSDPQGRDEAVAQERAQNSVKKGCPFWDPSIEGERAHEPWGAHPSLTRRSPWLTLLARCECLKRHGVGEREGELRADFTSIVLPRSRPPRSHPPRVTPLGWGIPCVTEVSPYFG